MRIECRETHGRGGQCPGAQHWRSEIQSPGKERSRRSEVIRLLRFREDIRDVVALVAPRVEIHGRIENSVGRAKNKSAPGKILRDPEPWRKVVLVGVHQ